MSIHEDTHAPAERRLLLIKHSLPVPVPRIDAHDWQLSDKGRHRCNALAERVAPYAPTIIVTSLEPKARETGDLVGRALNIPVESAPNLHEHDRTGVPWLDQDLFETAVRTFFDRPNDLVFGRETARESASRFSRAVEETLARHPTGTLAIVAHGTVISLYLAAKTGIDPFPLWQRLGLPSFVVLPQASGQRVEIVDSV
jgi:broad specificity phosphatase PhoE